MAKVCTHCGASVDDNEKVCSSCGAEFELKYFGINGVGLNDFTNIANVEKVLKEYKP